jgi:hypothetical protein
MSDRDIKRIISLPYPERALAELILTKRNEARKLRQQALSIDAEIDQYEEILGRLEPSLNGQGPEKNNG